MRTFAHVLRTRRSPTSKRREVTRDHRRSRKDIHVGRVSVFFRGASWHIYYREDGKARRVRIGPDRKDAEKRAAEVNAQIAHGVPSAYGYERVSVQGLVRLWLEHHELVRRSSVATVRRYRSADAPIVAEVRKARAELLEEAGCDLAELARQLNERAKASGRKVVNRSGERKRVRHESGE